MYRVIIAEDEMFVRIGLEHSIKWSDYEMEVVATVSNGIEALEKYRELKPHIIITDIKMPKMDGMKLIEEIRKEDKDIRFIILTCMEDFETAKSALHNAVSFYFVKSDINTNVIKEAICSIYIELKEENIHSATEKSNLLKLDKSEDIKAFFNNDKTKEVNDNILEYFEIDKNINDNFYNIGLILLFVDNEDILKSIINVIDELLKKQKLGKFLFNENNRIYVLNTRKTDDNKFEEIVKGYKHIISMIYSYFNVEATVLLNEEFINIITIKDNYEKLKLNEYLLFYSTTPINNLSKHKIEFSYDVIKNGMDRVVKYYKSNFDSEYSKEFYRYETFLNDDIVKDITRCKQFFSQWLQLYNAIMNITGINMKENQFEVLNKIEKSNNFELIISNIIEYMDEAKTDEESKEQMSVGLVKAINYINQNLDQVLTLPVVAEEVNFSAGYLSYLFTNEMNISFSSFILNLRIKKAKLMLEQTDEKLYIVAESVGFRDTGYFNKVFKKRIGLTPSKYRKENYKKFLGKRIMEKDSHEDH